MKRIFAVILVLLMAAVLMPAARPVAVKTDWDGFLARVAEQKLKNRGAWITLRSGERFKSFVIAATNDGLVVSSDRNTRQWSTEKGRALVPRGLVQGVQFTGKVGRRAMIGGIAGVCAAGALLALAATGAGGEMEASGAAGLLGAIPVFGIGGFFIGRAMDKPAPAFTIE